MHLEPMYEFFFFDDDEWGPRHVSGSCCIFFFAFFLLILLTITVFSHHISTQQHIKGLNDGINVVRALGMFSFINIYIYI